MASTLLRHGGRTQPPRMYTSFQIKSAERDRKPLASSVHSALSAFFRAYAVFLPGLENDFNLFQIVFIQTSPDARSRSPRRTTANLESIFRRIQDNETAPFMTSVPPNLHPSQLVSAFLREFTHVSSPSATCLALRERSAAVMTVSEASLFKAGVNIASAPTLSIGMGLSRGRQSLRQIKISNVTWQEYTRGCLRNLVWCHAEFVLRLILLEIDMDFGSKVGHKSLMAIVTKKILANVGVLGASTRSRAFGASASDSVHSTTAAVGIESSGSLQESYDDHWGVSGLHLIVFPVESIGLYKWRFYRGIDVCDAEQDQGSLDTESAERDNFLQSQVWQRNKTALNHCTGGDYNDIASNSPQQSSESLSPQESNLDCDHLLRENVLPSTDRNWIEVSSYGIPVPWTDIDLKPDLNEFAGLQLLLAAEYRAAAFGDLRKEEQSIRLIRSALRKCCYEATVRGLYDLSKCYKLGRGIQRERDTAKSLRFCATVLRKMYSARDVLCWILLHDSCLARDDNPEKRIIELMSLTRPLRFSLSFSGISVLPRESRDGSTRMVTCKRPGVRSGLDPTSQALVSTTKCDDSAEELSMETNKRRCIRTGQNAAHDQDSDCPQHSDHHRQQRGGDPRNYSHGQSSASHLVTEKEERMKHWFTVMPEICEVSSTTKESMRPLKEDDSIDASTRVKQAKKRVRSAWYKVKSLSSIRDDRRGSRLKGKRSFEYRDGGGKAEPLSGNGANVDVAQLECRMKKFRLELQETDVRLEGIERSFSERTPATCGRSSPDAEELQDIEALSDAGEKIVPNDSVKTDEPTVTQDINSLLKEIGPRLWH